MVSSFKQLVKPSLSTTSKLISGLNKLSDIVPLKTKISKEDLEYFRKVLVTFQDSSSFDLIDFLEGYTAVADSNIHSIYYVSELKKENKKVTIEIKDLWGKNADKVLLRAYNVADEDTNLVENEELKKDNTGFTWNYEKVELGTGVIQLEFTIISTKVTEQVKVVKSLKFETDIVIKDFKIQVNQKQLNDLLILRVNYPDLLQQNVHLNTNYSFGISFSVLDTNKKEIVPQQLFFRMVHVLSQSENTFLVRKSGSEFKLDIDIARAAKEVFKNLKGEYELELVVADEVIKNPVFWTFGKVFIDLENTYSNVKPEISHLFKAQVKRPSVTVSSTFTLLTLAPLLVFLILMFKLANLSGCYNYSFNLLLQLSVLSMLVVIGLYWTTISIFEAFGLLFILGTFSVFIGALALRK